MWVRDWLKVKSACTSEQYQQMITYGIQWNEYSMAVSLVWPMPLTFHLGFVHSMQDVALHQCLPLSSVCSLSSVVALDPTFSSPFLFEQFSVCQSFIERPCLVAIGHCWQDTLVHYLFFWVKWEVVYLGVFPWFFLPKQLQAALILAYIVCVWPMPRNSNFCN